ncbi:Outer membrane porin F precursor [Sporomusa ovata DSM 2662]|uniref:OmpA domain protein n=1 Tax=Sporomusa ovata TaxID=2378 RepID=A0A0U1KX15_9FIRM|nr:OmpA family protein [Sporomusa ovata]EQB28786.1 OmpA/MotB domain containing protein [Sporomusa ovata DSM 2662]CQR71941.1 OmpA domain protein [Sporomusa ovata]
MILRKSLFFFFLVLFPAVSAFAGQDNGKDTPYFSRMPNYYVVESSKQEYDSHTFVIQDGEARVEGKKYVVEYAPMDENNPPSAVRIIRNYANAAVSKGGMVLYEEDGERTLTARMQSGGSEIWLEVVVATSGEYRVTIVAKEALRQEVKASDLLAALNNDGHVPLYINFDTSMANIKPEHQPLIDEIVALLQQNPDLRLRIEGHTDCMGEPAGNKVLSERRAKAVMNTLLQKGIAADRLEAVGCGQEKPVADNATDAGRAKNRRVELVKKPGGQP